MKRAVCWTVVNAAPGVSFVFFGQVDPGVATPALDGNAYANLTNPASSGGAWRLGANQYYDMGGWRAATGQEAHSRATLGDAAAASFGFAGAPFAALGATAGYAGSGDYTLTSSLAESAGRPIPPGLSDIDGRAVLDPSAPDIGCRQG